MEQRRTDRAARVVEAAPDVVWRALTDQKALAAWLPPDGMTGRFERFEMRPGGGYRMVLTYTGDHAPPGKAGAHEDIVEVGIAEVIEGERIVQAVEFVSDDPAFSGVMRMTWRIDPQESGTKATIVAENVPPGIRKEDHDEGLRQSLANLARYVEGG
jgi:uncharacterized protein YndB with AHSA1/START domain